MPPPNSCGRAASPARPPRRSPRPCGFSEATLYKHFRDKEELLLRVLRERVPGFARVEITAGRDRVEDNIFRLVRGALDFYRETFPMLGSLLSEPGLMAAHHASIEAGTAAGPRARSSASPPTSTPSGPWAASPSTPTRTRWPRC